METLSILLRTFKKDNQSSLYKSNSNYYELFKENKDEVDCKLSNDLNYIAFTIGKSNKLVLTSIYSSSASGGYSASSSPSSSTSSSFSSSTSTFLFNSVLNNQQQQSLHHHFSGYHGSVPHHKEFQDKDLQLLRFYQSSSSSSSSSSSTSQNNNEEYKIEIESISNVHQYSWISPKVQKELVSLYNNTNNNDTTIIPQHLIVLDKNQKSLHLLSIFKNLNLSQQYQQSGNQSPVSSINNNNNNNKINDIKLNKTLCIVSPLTTSTSVSTSVTIKTFKNYLLHGFILPYEKIIEQLDLPQNKNNEIDIEIVSSDDQGNLVLLVQKNIIVLFKIKQIDNLNYIFFIQRRFNLSIGYSTREYFKDISSDSSSNKDYLYRYYEKWLFLLNRNNGQLDIWNINGKKRGIIQTKHFIKYETQQPLEIEDFSVPNDLMSIVIKRKEINQLYVLSLDFSFLNTPTRIFQTSNLINYCNTNKIDDECDIFSPSSFISNENINRQQQQLQKEQEINEKINISNEEDDTINSNDQNQIIANNDTDDEDYYEEDEDSEDELYSNAEDINNKNEVFQYHWFETTESKLKLDDNKLEFGELAHWVPKKSVSYPSNGFSISGFGSSLNQSIGYGNNSNSIGSGGRLSRENSFAINRSSMLTKSTSIADDIYKEMISSNDLSMSSASTLIKSSSNNNLLIYQQQQQQQQTYQKQLDDSSYILSISSPNEKEEQLINTQLFITPKLIVYQKNYKLKSNSDENNDSLFKSFKTEFYLYDRIRINRQSIKIIEGEKCLTIKSLDQSFYYFTENGINSILIDTNQQLILNNIIMLEGAESANHLCALNHWNKRDLKIHALHLGLKYRQLDVVEPALRSLDFDQQLIGSRLLINIILENSANAANSNVHNESFTNELLHIAMNFIGLIIKDRASLVHQSLKQDQQQQQQLQQNTHHINNINWTETLTTPLSAINNNNSLLSSIGITNSGYIENNSSNTASSPLAGNNSQSSAYHTLNSLLSFDNNNFNINEKTTPIQDLLLFTKILEALRLFQKEKQDQLMPKRKQQQQNNQYNNYYYNNNNNNNNQYNYQQLNSNELNQKQMNDMITWFPNGLIERWERMEELEIIKESLSSGNVSTLISYINWKREKKGLLYQQPINDPIQLRQYYNYNQNVLTSSSSLKFISPIGPFTFDDVSKISSCFIYQSVSQDQLEPAIKLLKTIGSPISPNLKQLAFNTTRRNIRNLLLDALAHHPMVKDPSFFTSEILELIDFRSKLDSLYPNFSYHREFSRLSFKWRPLNESKQPLLIQQQYQIQKHYQIQLKQQQQQQQQQQNNNNSNNNNGNNSNNNNNNQKQQINNPILPFDLINDDDIKLFCQEIDDFLPDTEHYYGFQVITHGNVSTSQQQTNVYSSGFLRGGGSIPSPINQSSQTTTNTGYRNRIILYPPPTNQTISSQQQQQSSLLLNQQDGNNQLIQSNDGYSHYTLNWLSKWSYDTKERILLDRKYQMDKRNVISKLYYSISHNQYNSILDWINSLSSKEIHYLRNLILNRFEKIKGEKVKEDDDNNDEKERLLYNSIIGALKISTPFVRDLFLNHLARNRIFLTDIETLPWFHINNINKIIQEKDKNYLLMKRLAYNHLLFPEFNLDQELKNNQDSDNNQPIKFSFKSHQYPLNQMIPIQGLNGESNSLDFHKFFIEFTIKNKLYLLLSSYLDCYRLAKNSNDRKKLSIDLDQTQLVRDDLQTQMLLLFKSRSKVDYVKSNLVNLLSILNRHKQQQEQQDLQGDSTTIIISTNQSETETETEEEEEELEKNDIDNNDSNDDNDIDDDDDEDQHIRLPPKLEIPKFINLSEFDKTSQIQEQLNSFYTIINNTIKHFPNRPLLALSSMIYSPTTFKDLLSGITDQGLKLNSKQLLVKIKKQYPTTYKILENLSKQQNHRSKEKQQEKQRHQQKHSSLFNVKIKVRDIISSKKDITLSELIDSNSIFNLTLLFGNQTHDHHNESSQKLLISDFSTQSFKEGYIDRLDVFYYLEKGRPMKSFGLLLKSLNQINGANGNNGEIQFINKEQRNLIGWLIRLFTIKRITQKNSVSAAIALLDLCKMDEYATMLRTDVSIIQRILNYPILNSSPNTPSQQHYSSPNLGSSSNGMPIGLNESFDGGVGTFSQHQRESINLMLSLYPTPESLLQTISNSLNNNISPFPSPVTPIHRVISRFESTINIDEKLSDNLLENNWFLLSKFCQCHAISKLTKQLEYLASQGNWLEFIYQAQVQEFPLLQIKEIIYNKIQSNGVRSHLLLVIEQISNERKRQYIGSNANNSNNNGGSELLELSMKYYPIEESKLNNDIIGYVLSAFRSNNPRNYLLYNATNNKRSLLAVIANCIQNGDSVTSGEDSTIECLVTWLCVLQPNLSKYLNGKIVNNTTANITVDDSFDFDLDALNISLDHHHVPNIKKYTNDDLIMSIQYIIQNRKTFILLQGFKIFLPTNILINYLKFINQFHQYRFEDSEESLQQFIKDLDNYDSSGGLDHHKFKSKESIKKMIIELSEELLDLLSSYEREHFIGILHRSGLSNIFSTLYSTLHLLKRTMIQDKNIHMDPKIIVQHLIEKGLFKEARTYSQENHLDKDIVTVAEVESLISHYQQGCLWEIEAERINLWKKSQQYFIQHKCKSEIAGEIFYNRGNNIPPSNEKVFLLSLAVEWFEKALLESTSTSITSSSQLTPNKTSNSIITQNFIDDLRKQILLLSVGVSNQEDQILNKEMGDEDNDNTMTSINSVSYDYDYDYDDSDREQYPQQQQHRRRNYRGNSNRNSLDKSNKDNISSQNLLSYFTSPLGSPSSSLSSSPTDFESSPLKDYTHHKKKQTNYVSGASPQTTNYLQSHLINNLSNAATINNTNLSSSYSKDGLSFISPIKSVQLEPKALDNVIAKLLNNDQMNQAEQIVLQFNYKSLDFDIITLMYKIVNRVIPPNPMNFQQELLDQLNRDFNFNKWFKSFTANPVSSFEITTENILAVLEQLLACCNQTKKAAKSIITRFNVSEKLSISYSELLLSNPYDILNQLLLFGKECFRLIKSFISTNHLDIIKINDILADLFSKTIIQQYNGGNSSNPSSPIMMSSLSISSEQQNDRKLSTTTNSGIDPNWSSEEFHEYIRIGRDPFTIGMKLIEATRINYDSYYSVENSPGMFGHGNHSTGMGSYVSPTINRNNNGNSNNKLTSPIGMDAEVELFVRAHFCFVVACSVDGTILVLNIVKSRINYYAEANKYKLLVRLITGMQCYNELQAILEILLQHNNFELLLRKKIHQHEDQNGLKLALHSFLLKKQPLYHDKLEMLFLRFNMYREIAVSHEQKAKARLESIGRDPKLTLNTNQSKQELLLAMKDFLDAADNYSKERSQRTAQSCISMGSLIALQIKSPEIRIINLKSIEAKSIMIQRSSFKEALIISNAYNLNAYSEWINVLFLQVIVNGNFNYLNEYISYFSYSNNLYIDLVKRYKTDTRAGKIQNIKHIIQNVILDKNLRIELAKELQLEDVIRMNLK